MPDTLTDELRSALAALLRAREELAHATTVQLREVVYREITSAEVSIARVLHLVGGP